MSAKPYDPTAPMAERLEALRSAVRKDTCGHDWVHVQGATICANCGADLNKMLDEYRKISDPEAGGVRVAVSTPVATTQECVPAGVRWAIYIAAGLIGLSVGLKVVL